MPFDLANSVLLLRVRWLIKTAQAEARCGNTETVIKMVDDLAEMLLDLEGVMVTDLFAEEQPCVGLDAFNSRSKAI